MAGRVRAVARFALPSVFATAFGVFLAGLAEGMLHMSSWLEVFAASGFAALIGVPIGFALSLAVRGLWRSWRPEDLFDSMDAGDGGAPRLAAWFLAIGVGALVLAAATFNMLRLALRISAARDVVALATATGVAAFAALLVLVSRPVVGALTRAMSRLDRALRDRLGRSLFGPIKLLVGSGIFIALALYISWKISIRPRIGHLDLAFLVYPAVLFGAMAAAHALWVPIARRGAVLAASVLVCVLATTATVGTALYTRHVQQFAMLQVWAGSPTAGFAINQLYDFAVLRREMTFGDITPTAREGASHPDVILITVDTVRADHTPPYGGEAAMPTLQKLADRGARFVWAFSPGNVTRRSLPTIALGLSPHRVRGRVAGWALKLDPRHILLAERFRAAGYDTAGYLCCGSHFWPRHRLGLIRGIDHLVVERDGAKLSKLARDFLSERRASGTDKPLFLWMHFIEPHDWLEREPMPEKQPKQSRKVYRSMIYDLSLSDVDGFMGTVLGEVDSATSIIAVTADHGEGLDEHGAPHHSTDLYNSQIRVPLVIAGPGVKHAAIDEPVGLVRVAATLLDLAGFEPPEMPEMDGSSLGPLLRGEAAKRPGEAYSVMIQDRSVAAGVRALIVGKYKLIKRDDREKVELYDIVADPNELKNLDEKEPVLVDRLRARLKERRDLDSIAPF